MSIGDISLWTALFAGALSFLSPCVLPLVPPYLCYMAGISIDQFKGDTKVRPASVLLPALFFTLGFATVFVTDFTYASRPSLELEMLFVADPWRRHGVGRALMDAVIAHARYGGYVEMEWNVLKTNARAQAFYRQFGADVQPEWDRWGLVL